MKAIFGLIGAKSSGKTTAFDFIKELIPVQEITLAGKLKDVCAEIFCIPRHHFDDHRYKERELDAPVFLTTKLLMQIYDYYFRYPDYDKYIRPHVGMILYTPRQIAQYIGTEVLRAVDTDIHCMAATEITDGGVWVVTDMRFVSEYKFFKERWPELFYPIYIRNPGAEIAAARDQHASEQGLKELVKLPIRTIANETTIQAFQENIRSYVLEVLK